MDDNIVRMFTEKSAADPDLLLDSAKGHYKSLFVLGWTPEGRLQVRASSNLSRSDMLWITEQFKMILLNVEFGEGDD